MGWQEASEQFEECVILADAEKQKMAEIAQPAWKAWIVDGFRHRGAQLVDELWAEVDRIEADLEQQDQDLYLEANPDAQGGAWGPSPRPASRYFRRRCSRPCPCSAPGGRPAISSTAS